MNFNKTKTKNILKFIRSKTRLSPSIGVITGLNLIPDIEHLKRSTTIPFSKIPHLRSPSAKGHKGQFIFGNLSGKDVVIQEGRLHLYEGVCFEDMLRTLFIMKNLGIKDLIILNAAGGINPKFKPGDMMVVTNHINLMGTNPLIGLKTADPVSLFMDLCFPYDPSLIKLASKCASKNKIKLHKGIYTGVTGPTYETEAEIKAFRNLGTDAMGMSLPPETIFARYLGLNILAISVITNVHKKKRNTLSHYQVIDQYSKINKTLFTLVKDVIRGIK